MDNNEELMGKVPFYMTYPMQNLYLTEMEYEKDMERMKELYPKEVMQIQRMVEKRCDELELEGSRIYDENPDRLMMEEEARKIYICFLTEHPEMGTPPEPSTPSVPMPMPMPMPPSPMVPSRPSEPMRPMPSTPSQPSEPMRPMPPSPMVPSQPGMDMGRPMPSMPPQSMLRRYTIEPPAEYRDLVMENRPPRRERCDNPWLCSLIGVIFNNEVYRRRCRHRRCRRWW